MKRVITAIIGLFALMGSLLVWAAPASASDACTAGHNASGRPYGITNSWGNEF
jgi:hypothetical protein